MYVSIVAPPPALPNKSSLLTPLSIQFLRFVGSPEEEKRSTRPQPTMDDLRAIRKNCLYAKGLSARIERINGRENAWQEICRLLETNIRATKKVVRFSAVELVVETLTGSRREKSRRKLADSYKELLDTIELIVDALSP